MNNNNANAIHWSIAIYGRVSTSLQEDQKTIENQIMAIKDFADEKFGKGNYTIIEEYLDEGWSGDSLIRPRLDQLRIDATKKIWDIVIIYDPDRLARRSAWQEIVTEELKELGIDILYVTIPQAKTEEDKIMQKMRGVFNEFERMKIAERFRIGKLRKVKEGHILISEALYGYRYVPNNKDTKEHGYYIINEEEAEVVRKIFTWIGEERLTIRQVVRRLQELNIKPRRSKRGVWNTSTLTTMLRHKGYIGQAHWGSSYAVLPVNPIKTGKYKKIKKSSRKIKPEGDWIARNIPIPIIISEELFLKVQAQLKTNSALCERNTKNQYLIGGKIFCSCGRKRCSESPQHGKYLYYRCSDRIYSFPLPYICKEKGINAKIADQLLWQEITKLITSPNLLMAQINKWIEDRKNKIQPLGVNVEAIEKDITRLDAQVERYNTAFGAGVISLEKLRGYVEPRNKQIEKLKAQIKEAKQEKICTDVATIPTEKEIKVFARAAIETLKDLSFEKKQVIIRSIIEKIIGTQQQLQVYGKIPLTLNYVAYKSNSRNCGIAQRR
jgi:site-specific DNA recombinase